MIRRIRIEDGMAEAVAAAAGEMERGGVVIFPTETVYGIGVVAGDAAAVARLRMLKGRAADQPFQFLTTGIDMARRMGAVFSARAARLARNYWPGPLTLVVPDGGGSTLGIRVPDSPFALALIERLGRAIVASSANPAGMPPPVDADAADGFSGGRDEVALLVDGGAATGGTPSTVVRCIGDEYEILRDGGVNREAIRAAWEA
jgi:L-threonylcarbamoyladenylate synthase